MALLSDFVRTRLLGWSTAIFSVVCIAREPRSDLDGVFWFTGPDCSSFDIDLLLLEKDRGL